MIFQPAIVIDHDRNLLSPFISPHAVVINLLDMPESVLLKIILNTAKKCNFLPETGRLVFPCFCCDPATVAHGNFRMIIPVLIEAGDLAPVNVPVLIRLAVEHVGIHTTDGKTPVIYPAPVVFKEITGSAIVVLCPECIPGNVKCPVLVTELRKRSRLDRTRIDLPCADRVTIEEEHVAIERPGAASAAEIAPEPDIPDNVCQVFLRVGKKGG